MSKWFGQRPDAIAVVDAPVSRLFALRARVALFVVAAVVGLPVAVVLSAVAGPATGLLAGLLVGFVCGVVAAVLVRVWPVLRVLWWWASEITLTVGLLFGSLWLARLSHPVVPLLVLAAVAGVVAMVRPVRRRVAAIGWCLVVRHRLRLSFSEFVRSVGRSAAGRLPLILWACPTPAGERVWLWLRPGLDLTDLDGKAGKLAVACWASEVRMVRASARYAALLRIDVTRRDPLTGLVASPLAAWIPADIGTETAVPLADVSGLPLDLLDVPEPEPVPAQRGPRR